MTNRREGKRRNAHKQPVLPGLGTGGKGHPGSNHSQTQGLRAQVGRLTTPGEYALDLAKQRLAFFFLVFGILFLVIVGRLADLTLFNDQPEIAANASPTATMGSIPLTNRADIVDRNGTALATSLPTVTLLADARRILDIDDAVAKLKTVLPDIDAQKLTDDLKTAKRYVTIRRRLPPRQYYEINKLGIAGLDYAPDESRIYPSGSLTAHIVGYTDIDNNGIAGIEKSQNKYLADNKGPLKLTVDLRLQTILHRELNLAIQEYKALGGVGLVMDIASGEILALVSLPDFDPQRAGSADDDAKFNRATLGVYEMGSTMKLINTALSLDSGLIRPSDRFDTTHPIEVGHKTIKDYHAADHNMNVAEILMVSSNLGSARMAEKVGSSRQRAFLSRLGLMDKSSIELPEVSPPLIPPPSSWGDATTMTVSFGHGIAINAIQLVGAVASILNDGMWVRPTLLKSAADETKSQQQRQRVVSSRTSAEMKALMRLVVKAGTGKSAEVQGYVVGGKTGTADKLSGRHYSENARMSSFLGVFPANAPRYLVYTLLDDPKGNTKTYGYATGGWTAAPVVGKVISQIGPLLDLPPLEPEMVATTERQLLRILGNDVLSSLNIEKESESYAASESSRTR